MSKRHKYLLALYCAVFIILMFAVFIDVHIAGALTLGLIVVLCFMRLPEVTDDNKMGFPPTNGQGGT